MPIMELTRSLNVLFTGNVAVIKDVLELVHQQYLPGIEFYQVWLRYQTQLQRDHKAGFLRLFDIITKDFPHFQLIATCVDHVLELYEDELMVNEANLPC